MSLVTIGLPVAAVSSLNNFPLGLVAPSFNANCRPELNFDWLAALGGYVKMRGDELNETHLSEDSYGNKPVWQRMLVVLAGPAINFILTIIIYCFLFVVGVPTVKPLIASVIPNTTAADANFKANDEITQVGQYDAHSWSRVVKLLLIHYQDQDPINITTYNHPKKRTIHHQVNLSQWVINVTRLI